MQPAAVTEPAIRTVTATRYVAPLHEGGSLPAIVEADDDGLYVLKFRGAGQGHKALIAELVAGEIGRALGLRVPEIVFVELDPDAWLGDEPAFESVAAHREAYVRFLLARLEAPRPFVQEALDARA